MARYRATTGLREIINEKKTIAFGAAILMIAGAGLYLAYMQRPQLRPNGDKAFYTVDDGQTWFIDSIYKTPPFDHNGKVAVRAMVYSYDNGHQMFCPAVERYTSDTKTTLDNAIAQAVRDGKPLTSISVFNSPETMDGMEVKLSGSGNEWISRSDKDKAAKVLSSVKAPDGSAVDSVIP